MNLSAEQFSQIITSLDQNQPGTSSDDSRRTPRVDVQATATIIPLCERSHPGAMIVEIRDLSHSGVGFINDLRMNLDDQFALVLERAGESPAVVLCSVASWQPLTRDTYAIGARFKRIIRDGGASPLPIYLEPSVVAQAAEDRSMYRKAS